MYKVGGLFLLTMKDVINIYHKKAAEFISAFKTKQLSNLDIKLENVHLKRLNSISSYNIFSHSDLYVASSTLYELMQPQGKKGSHNYHELTPDDIIEGLRSLQKPKAIVETQSKRIIIITVCFSHFELPLMFVIERNTELTANVHKKVNKLITAYPKDEIDKYIDKSFKKLYIK